MNTWLHKFRYSLLIYALMVCTSQVYSMEDWWGNARELCVKGEFDRLIGMLVEKAKTGPLPKERVKELAECIAMTKQEGVAFFEDDRLGKEAWFVWTPFLDAFGQTFVTTYKHDSEHKELRGLSRKIVAKLWNAANKWLRTNPARAGQLAAVLAVILGRIETGAVTLDGGSNVTKFMATELFENAKERRQAATKTAAASSSGGAATKASEEWGHEARASSSTEPKAASTSIARAPEEGSVRFIRGSDDSEDSYFDASMAKTTWENIKNYWQTCTSELAKTKSLGWPYGVKYEIMRLLSNVLPPCTLSNEIKKRLIRDALSHCKKPEKLGGRSDLADLSDANTSLADLNVLGALIATYPIEAHTLATGLTLLPAFTFADLTTEIFSQSITHQKPFTGKCTIQCGLDWCSCITPADRITSLIQVARYILETHPDKREITIASLASGHLLYEYLLIGLLKSKGYQAIRLYVVDPGYATLDKRFDFLVKDPFDTLGIISTRAINMETACDRGSCPIFISELQKALASKELAKNVVVSAYVNTISLINDIKIKRIPLIDAAILIDVVDTPGEEIIDKFTEVAKFLKSGGIFYELSSKFMGAKYKVQFK